MLRDEVIRHDRRYSRRRRGSFAAVAVTLQCAVFRGFQNCRPYLSFATPRDTRVRWPHHDFGCRESVSLGVTRIRGKGVLDERVRTGYRRSAHYVVPNALLPLLGAHVEACFPLLFPWDGCKLGSLSQ